MAVVSSTILVRHAQPLVSDNLPPAEWPLSDEGRRAAAALGRALDVRAVASVWVSGERKAHETAVLAFPHAAIRCRDELNEVARPWYSQPQELTDAMAAYLSGDDMAGWEPHDQVADRVARVLSELSSAGRVAIVSHGALLTALVDWQIGLEHPFEFWSGLRMPDVWKIDGKSVRRAEGRRTDV
jgi:broad specificity phosphatase PhoE